MASNRSLGQERFAKICPAATDSAETAWRRNPARRLALHLAPRNHVTRQTCKSTFVGKSNGPTPRVPDVHGFVKVPKSAKKSRSRKGTAVHFGGQNFPWLGGFSQETYFASEVVVNEFTARGHETSLHSCSVHCVCAVVGRFLLCRFRTGSTGRPGRKAFPVRLNRSRNGKSWHGNKTRTSG